MNYDKLSIRNAYQKELAQHKNAVDADELRALGYSEEDILNAQL